MPISPINVAGLDVPDYDVGIRDFFGNMLRTAADREKVKQEAVKSKYAEERAKADIAYQKAHALQAERSAEFGNLTGDAGKALSMHLLEQRLGKNHPAVQQAREMYELERQSQNILNENRNILNRTADKRYATSMGRVESELQDIRNGIQPGTRENPVPLAPEEQRTLEGQWRNKLQKEFSDTKTREKGLYATNIDKTLSTINPDDITRYAGLAGGLEKKLEQGKTLAGKESENYRKYEEAMTSVKFLTSQIRQFYGDSIQPAVREHLEEIANPATWRNNPALAKRKFNQMKKILDMETKTFKQAINTPDVYNEFSEPTSNYFDKPSGDYTKENLEYTAKKYNMTVDQLKNQLGVE